MTDDEQTSEPRRGFLSRVFGGADTERLALLETEVEALRSNVIEREHDLESLRDAHATAVAAKANVEKKLAGALLAAKRATEADAHRAAKVTALERDVAAAAKQVAELDAKHRAEQRALEKAAAELKAEREAHQTTRRKLASVDKDRARLSADLALATGELQQLRNASSERERVAEELEAKARVLAAAEAELRTLREQLRAHQAPSSDRRRAREGNNEAVAAARRELEARAETLATALRDVQKELSTASAELEASREEIEALTRALDDAQRARSTIEEEVALAYERNAALSQELTQERDTVAQLAEREVSQQDERNAATGVALWLGDTTSRFLDDVFGDSAPVAWRRWAEAASAPPSLASRLGLDDALHTDDTALARALRSLGVELRDADDGYALHVDSAPSGLDAPARVGAPWLAHLAASVLGHRDEATLLPRADQDVPDGLVIHLEREASR